MIDFEMALTGADFKSALTSVFFLVGRPIPERSQMTRKEWQDLRESREHDRAEAADARYFADAARVMTEEALDVLPTADPERAIHTEFIAALKHPETEYRNWCQYHPEWARALVEAGRMRARRLQLALARYLMGGVSDAS